MDGIERIIGKLEEFKDTAEKRFDRLEHKVETIQHFKWKVIGGSTMLSFLLAALIEFLGLLK